MYLLFPGHLDLKKKKKKTGVLQQYYEYFYSILLFKMTKLVI